MRLNFNDSVICTRTAPFDLELRLHLSESLVELQFAFKETYFAKNNSESGETDTSSSSQEIFVRLDSHYRNGSYNVSQNNVYDDQSN